VVRTPGDTEWKQGQANKSSLLCLKLSLFSLQEAKRNPEAATGLPKRGLQRPNPCIFPALSHFVPCPKRCSVGFWRFLKVEVHVPFAAFHQSDVMSSLTGLAVIALYF
jgi:hypothetical protein